MEHPYMLYVNGILAKRFMTKGKAIRYAMQYFPSYIKDERTGAVVWKGI